MNKEEEKNLIEEYKILLNKDINDFAINIRNLTTQRRLREIEEIFFNSDTFKEDLKNCCLNNKNKEDFKK